MSENIQQVATDELRVGGRDSFCETALPASATARQPIDFHSGFESPMVLVEMERIIDATVVIAGRHEKGHFHIRLKNPVTNNWKAQRGPAQPKIDPQRCAFHVFNDVWFARRYEQRPNRFYQIRVFSRVLVNALHHRKGLTGRARVNHVKLFNVNGRHEGIALNEIKRVIFNWVDVDANNVSKSGVAVAHRSPAATAEQIQQPFWWYSLIRQGVNLHDRFANWLGSFNAQPLFEPFSF